MSEERIVLLKNVTLEVTGPWFWQERKLALIPEEIVLTGVKRIKRLEVKGRITTSNWTGGDLDGWLTVLDMEGVPLQGEPLGGWRLPIDWGFLDNRVDAPFRNTVLVIDCEVPTDSRGRPIPIKLVPRTVILYEEFLTGIELSATFGYAKAVIEEFAVVVDRVQVRYVLAVTVTDAATGKPVEGASVTVGGETKQTGSDGRVEFMLPGGTYDVRVSKSGYGGYSARINLVEDTSLSVALHPVQPGQPEVHVIELIANAVLEGNLIYYGQVYAQSDWYIERCDKLLYLEAVGELECDNWLLGEAVACAAIVDVNGNPLPGEPSGGYGLAFDRARGWGRYRGPFAKPRLDLNVSVGKPVWVRQVASRWIIGEMATKASLSLLGGYCRVSLGSFRLVYQGTPPQRAPPQPVQPLLPRLVVKCVDKEGRPVPGVEVRCYSQCMASLVGAAMTGPDGAVTFQVAPGGYIILAHHHERRLTAKPVLLAVGVGDAHVTMEMVRKPVRVTIEAEVKNPFTDPGSVAAQLRRALADSGLRVEECTVSGRLVRVVAFDEGVPAWVYLALVLAILVAFYLISLRVDIKEVVEEAAAAVPSALKWAAVGAVAFAVAALAASLSRRE